jgi:ferric iron reductase protein FhuF
MYSMRALSSLLQLYSAQEFRKELTKTEKKAVHANLSAVRLVPLALALFSSSVEQKVVFKNSFQRAFF